MGALRDFLAQPIVHLVITTLLILLSALTISNEDTEFISFIIWILLLSDPLIVHHILSPNKKETKAGSGAIAMISSSLRVNFTYLAGSDSRTSVSKFRRGLARLGRASRPGLPSSSRIDRALGRRAPRALA